MAELPKPAKIDLSYFSGRILPQNVVHAGTFSISVPKIEQINGPNAIISYEIDQNSPYGPVKLTAWMPDPKTPNIFQKGEMIHTPMELWGDKRTCFTTIGSVSLKNNAIYVYANRDSGEFGISISFIALLMIIFALLSIMNYSFSKRDNCI